MIRFVVAESRYLERYRRAILVSAILLAVASSLDASPITSVGPSQRTSWTDAVNSMNVRPVEAAAGFTMAELAFYSDVVFDRNLNGLARATAILTPDFEISASAPAGADTLVISWTTTDFRVLTVSSWEYVYDDDPDLTDTRFKTALFAPPRLQDMGIILIDESGRSCGWFRRGIPDRPQWTNYGFDPPPAASHRHFTDFFCQPGFDLTRVVRLRVSQSALVNRPFLMSDPTGNGNAWAAWNYFRVIPEPSSLLALAAGLIGLACFRRK